MALLRPYEPVHTDDKTPEDLENLRGFFNQYIFT